MRDTNSISTPVTVESLAAGVTELADRIYLSLTTIGTALTILWDDLTEKLRAAPRSTDLAPLRETIGSELELHGKLLDGAGVVMAENVLADRPRYLEWWLSDPEHGPRPLRLELDPRSEYFYDYTAMDWFVIPRDQGRRWVHGPCIDFACTDQYICTFAIPVTSAPGTFLGVAGADVPVAAIEEALLPRFRASNLRLALVNSEGRVILGTDPEFTPGSKTSRMDRGAAEVPIDAMPWSLHSLGPVTSR